MPVVASAKTGRDLSICFEECVFKRMRPRNGEEGAMAFSCEPPNPRSGTLEVLL